MERELIDWLVREFRATGNTVLGIGDDAAVLPVTSGNLVVTCDSICEGIHFQSSRHSPEQIGYKALAVNLSDLAAMGARPCNVVVSLVIPVSCNLEYVQKLFHGMRPLLDQFEVDLCGGDTAIWKSNQLVVTVTAIGAAPTGGCWRIDGASPGDRVLVTGQFGGSILGNHLSFQPRCAFASQWREHDLIRACTDVSDSLGLDLAKISRASGVGFEIDSGAIPISPAARELAHNGQGTALDHALQDGEDFELIVIASPHDAEQLVQHTPDTPGLTEIGQCIPEREYFLIESGNRIPFEPVGYQHGESG